eukprot:197617-Rhodomonas_salina.1
MPAYTAIPLKTNRSPYCEATAPGVRASNQWSKHREQQHTNRQEMSSKWMSVYGLRHGARRCEVGARMERTGRGCRGKRMRPQMRAPEPAPAPNIQPV